MLKTNNKTKEINLIMIKISIKYKKDKSKFKLCQINNKLNQGSLKLTPIPNPLSRVNNHIKMLKINLKPNKSKKIKIKVIRKEKPINL